MNFNEDGLLFSIKHKNARTGDVESLESAQLVLGGLGWMDGEVASRLERFLSGSGENQELGLLFSQENRLQVFLRTSDTGLETLVKVTGTSISAQQLIDELERIGAFSRPILSTQTHQDGSEFQEILVQSELVSVEEVSVASGVGYRVTLGGGRAIVATMVDGGVLISDSQTFLEAYVGGPQTLVSACPNISSGFVEPSFLVDQVWLDRYSPLLSIIDRLTYGVSFISIDVNSYSTDILFSKMNCG